MGCAPIAHLLYSEVMSYSSANPKWANRDRFVLSNGHACALQYTMMHLTGYSAVGMEDLKQFRQLGSRTPGHPENHLTEGVEVATGPLGQGICNAVGMAIAESHLAAEFNKPGGFEHLVDHHTYVICGDGCLQEGISSEACSLAGHLKLGKLIVCYDDNKITIDGPTSLSFTEDVGKRFEAYNWQVITVTDVNDLPQMRNALAAAHACTDKPTLLKISTVIGHGSGKAGTAGVHGAPLGAADLAQVKSSFGMDGAASFVVPPMVAAAYEQVTAAGKAREADWNTLFAAYQAAHPKEAAEFTRRMNHSLEGNDAWKASLPVYDPADTKAVATRQRSEQVLNAIATQLPELMGGSADLTPSNLTNLKCSSDYQANTPNGRYIRFGVREHGMAAICNGMFAHGGVRPYCATFLNFAGYALGSIRLSCLSGFGVIYVMTHDSIGLGEDGPTHQPIEMLPTLRAHPNIHVIRPADGNETAGAYAIAMKHARTPTVLCLSRQGLPTLSTSSADKVALGAYVVGEFASDGSAAAATPSLVIVATGSEVSLALNVATAMMAAPAAARLHIRVVSMPCCELFDQQSMEYKLSIFPDNTPVMSVEASSVYGWNKYAHVACGLNTFGMSAPGDKVYAAFGLTVPALTARAQETIAHHGSVNGGQAPSLVRYLKQCFVVPGGH